MTTLLLLHYWAGSAREWQAVIALLGDRYQCLAIDLPGYGDAPGGADERGYSVDDMADYVADLIHRQNTGAVAVVGHSMGGKVALALAAGSPDRGPATRPPLTGLTALVLLSPSPPTPEPMSDVDRQQLLDGYGQRTQAEKTVRNITQMPLSGRDHDQVVADNLRTTRPAWDAWLTAGSNENLADRMVTISVPVRILVGTDDRAIPPDVQRTQTLPYLPQATLTTVPGAGHLLPYETPAMVARFIADVVPIT